MAIIVGQQSSFWQGQAEKHPGITGCLKACAGFLDFFLNFHFVVFAGRWLVLVCSRISETALLFATLWITATYVVPDATSLLGKTSETLSSLSLMAFSLLPEVILFGAIVTTYEHWHRVVQDRNNVGAWIWSILHTIPTGMFFLMTVYTISTFIASKGHIAQASGIALVIRCLAGWFYSLIGLIYSKIGQPLAPVTETDALASPVPTIDYQQLADILLPTLRDEMMKLIPVPAQPDYQQMASNLVPLFETNIETKYAPQFHFLHTQLQELGSLLLTQIATKNETGTETKDETIDETEDETNSCSDEHEERETNPRIIVPSRAKKPHAKRETKHATNSTRGAARQKALRILNANNKISPADLAKKAGITTQYASQIMKQQAKQLA